MNEADAGYEAGIDSLIKDINELQDRNIKLAQVALEMLEALRTSRNSAYGFYRRLLEGCGVTVDD